MLIQYANMAEYEELPDFSSASQSEIAFDSSREEEPSESEQSSEVKKAIIYSYFRTSR